MQRMIIQPAKAFGGGLSVNIAFVSLNYLI